MSVRPAAAPGKKTIPELRKFGLTVGGVFLLFGTISWWRGHVLPPRIFWTLGTLLVVPGAVAPALLAPVERGWMRFAEKLGAINARIILSILYYLVITPVGVLRRLKTDPLNRRMRDGKSNWIKRDPSRPDKESYRQQF